MKLSLVLVAVGLVTVCTACSRERTESDRATTITSAPLDPPTKSVALVNEPDLGTPTPAPTTQASQAATSGSPAIPRDVTPPATPTAQSAAAQSNAAETAGAAPASTTAAPAPATKTTRSSRSSDLVERGQLVGPSLAPATPPSAVVVFQNGGYGAPRSQDLVQPSTASTQSPADFAPRPRSAAPVTTGQITSFTGTSTPMFGSSPTHF